MFMNGSSSPKHFRARYIALIILLAISGYAGFLAWRAHKDVVTLHVRNEPLGEVLKALRWQTWESFRSHKEVDGKITLDVDEMPLEQVLQIISDQTSSRWSAIYPIYARKTALSSLDQALKGEIEFSTSRFTNAQGRGFGGPMRGGFGDTVLNQNKLVSLQLTNKELKVAALALSRFGQARVLPENGLSPKVNLVLSQEPFDSAVAKVAKNVKRSWTKVYALEPARGGFAAFRPGRPMDRGAGSAGGPGGREGRGPFSGDRNLTPEQRQQMEKRGQELMETLPPEQRQEMQERRAALQAMQSLPPDQRRELMEARMNSPEMQQRMEQRMSSGIRNSTPEQRRERYERMHQMRKARAAGGAPSR